MPKRVLSVRRRPLAAACCAVVAASALSGTSSAAGPCTHTWVGDVDTNWMHDAGGDTNWNTDTLPGPGDHACLPANGGTPYDVVLSSSVDIADLTVAANARLTIRNGAVLRAGSKVTNAGRIVIDAEIGQPTLAAADGNAGTVETITNTGAIEFLATPTSGNPGFVSGDIANSGAIDVNDDAAELDENGHDGGRDQTITNAAGGTIDIAEGVQLRVNNRLVQTGTITNAGSLRIFDEDPDFGALLRVTGGSLTGNPAEIAGGAALQFAAGAGTATGAVRVDSSALLSGDVPEGYSITVRAGAVLRSPTSFSNAGRIVIDAEIGQPTLAAADGSAGTVETITNTGTIEFLATPTSGNPSFVSGDVANSGVIDVNDHAAELDENGHDGGRDQTITNAAGGTIDVAEGVQLRVNNRLHQGGSITNAGSLIVFDEDPDFGALLRVTGGSLTGNPAEIAGGAGLQFAPGAGAAAATGAVRVDSSSLLSGDVPQGYTITVRAGAVLRSPTSFTNAGRIVIDAEIGQPTLAAADGSAGTVETITNTGTIEFLATPTSGNPSFVSGDIVNSGTIEVDDHTAELDENGHDGGRDQTITNAAGGTIAIADGVQLRINNRLVQAGTITNGGGLVIHDEDSDPGALLRVTGGSLTGNPAEIAGGAGLQFGPGASAPQGAVRVSSSGLLSGSVPAGYTVTIRTGAVLRSPTSFTNAGRIVIDAEIGQPTLAAADGDAATAETIINKGTIEFLATPTSGNPGFVSGDVDNRGVIEVEDDPAWMRENGHDGGRSQTITNTGTVELTPPGRLALGSEYVQTGGTTIVPTGSAIASEEGRLIDIQGGLLTGTGSVGPDLRNGGRVAPGSSPGTLTVTDDYTQTAAGTLVVELGGLEASTEYDVLDVADDAALGGTLEVKAIGGYRFTAHGDRFQVIKTGPDGVMGTFAEVDSPRHGQYALATLYRPSEVVLETRDVQAPETTLTSAPTSVAEGATASFTFASSEPGSTFECRLDGGNFDPCSGPGGSHTTGPLAAGDHQFEVWAIDAVGNVDRTYESWEFRVGQPRLGGGGDPAPVPVTQPAPSEESFDALGPELTVSRPRLPRAIRPNAKLTLTVHCSEACTASAGADLARRRGRGRRPALKGSAAQMAAGTTQAFTLTFTRPGAARVRRLLRRRRARVVIDVVVVATDGAGNESVARQRVTLRRRR